VKTIASSIKGGVLSDSGNTGYIPPTRPKRSPGVPDTEDEKNTPIGEGWDVILLFIFLYVVYALYLKRKDKLVEWLSSKTNS
jgi:hypothetical protein